MEITAKELRGKPGQMIEQASRGTEIVITIHGKKMARLVPYGLLKNDKEEDEIFGLWKDHNVIESVDEIVRTMRKGRKF